MHPIIRKSFAGMAPSLYVRHFLFACVFLAIFVMASISSGKTPFGIWLLMVVSTFLYPYSRFTYEGIVGYIAGNNMFLVDGLLFIAAKIASMLMCWLFAVFIAPLGLLYLYLYHSRKVD